MGRLLLEISTLTLYLETELSQEYYLGLEEASNRLIVAANSIAGNFLRRREFVLSSRRYIFFEDEGGGEGVQKIPLLPSKKMKLALKEKLKFDFGSQTNTGKELKRFFETYFQFLF